MSDTPAPSGVDALRDAISTPAKRVRAKPKAKDEPAAVAGGASPRPGVPEILPDESPVQALGTKDGNYYYINSLGELRERPEEKHGRLNILSLFGGDEYLKKTWPVWEEIDGRWIAKNKFDHDKIAPVLMLSCTRKGLWDPAHQVRGVGSWIEDDGSLVMHQGERLFVSNGGRITESDPGLRGDLVYPRRPKLPFPEWRKEKEPPGAVALEMLCTWNWVRGDLDAMLMLGWIICAYLGQAQTWRPALWLTGARGRGKSKLQKLIMWLFGDSGIIRPELPTPAFIYQSLSDSCLPVSLDEFESKADNAMQDRVVELMRVSTSGGSVGRGGSDNNPKLFRLLSCFLFGSINMQALTPQDRSRLAICELEKLDLGEQSEMAFDVHAPKDDDVTLGKRDKWALIGRQLRGRLLTQWSRYDVTFRAYRFCLIKAGHDSRAAEQFGALGAGFDIAMYEAFDMTNAEAWAKKLPAASLAETSDINDNARDCLNHLLMATPDLVRDGTRETVSHFLQEAKNDIEAKIERNDTAGAAHRVLAKLGIRVMKRKESMLIDDKIVYPFEIAVSINNPGLRKIFEGTAWRGRPDGPGTWAQALRDLPMVGKSRQERIDKVKQRVVPLLWDVVFETLDGEED